MSLSLSDVEAARLLNSLKFTRRHKQACRTANSVAEWEPLDGRKTCLCPYYSCGVHDPAEGFRRKPTGEVFLEKAKALVKLRLIAGKDDLRDPNRTEIKTGIADFIQSVVDAGSVKSTQRKYQTLMDQLQAFSDWKNLKYLSELGQDEVLEFRRSWEDPKAGYKLSVFQTMSKYTPNGTPKQKWTSSSIFTCKQNAKTLRLLFNRWIERKWLTENPTSILKFPKNKAKLDREDVKYLTPDQMMDILSAVDQFDRMPEYSKLRLKALILVMRWTGLRINDAVILSKDSIKGDVLYLKTGKTKSKVEIPLHEELMEALAKLTPYEGKYYFWNRRSEASNARTAHGNFGGQIAEVFRKAGVKTDESDIHLVSHMFRNTFAVHLLEKGVPLETVSLMLAHKSIQTTERYYADFSPKYMSIAQKMVRKVWTLKEGETLDVAA